LDSAPFIVRYCRCRLFRSRRAWQTMTPGLIDMRFHLIPQFYRDAVYEAGKGV
jgi:hypothetical protein